MWRREESRADRRARRSHHNPAAAVALTGGFAQHHAHMAAPHAQSMEDEILVMRPPPPIDDEQQPRKQLELPFRPGFFWTVFMLPFPFCCIGCCISESTHLLFDDEAEQLRVRSFPGYCWCCDEHFSVPYSHVQNVRLEMDPSCRMNKKPSVRMFIQRRSETIEGEKLYIGSRGMLVQMLPQAAKLHRACFARGDSEAYEQPASFFLRA